MSSVASSPAVRPTPVRQLAQKMGAELVGTFALVFAGCGAIMVDETSGGAVTHVGIGLSFGLVIMAMVHATGHVSGAHLNPAVTLAFAVIGRFGWRSVLPYALSQLAGAMLAAASLRVVLGTAAGLGATAPGGTAGQALVMEVLLTFLLMFVITSVATDARAVGHVAGLAIGGTVALAAIFAGPVSGASMNPARSLGPALVSNRWDSAWVYVCGPAAGAVLGALAYRLVRCSPDDGRSVRGCC